VAGNAVRTEVREDALEALADVDEEGLLDLLRMPSPVADSAAAGGSPADGHGACEIPEGLGSVLVSWRPPTPIEELEGRLVMSNEQLTAGGRPPLHFVMGVVLDAQRADIPWGEVDHLSGDGGLQALQQRTTVIRATRERALQRRQITHYRCLSCRKMVPKTEKKCGNCDYVRGESGAQAMTERERARAANRQNTAKGRIRNQCTNATVDGTSLAVVPSSAFEEEWQRQLAKKRQRVGEETDALAVARCGVSYLQAEDSHATVLESFLQAWRATYTTYFSRVVAGEMSSMFAVGALLRADELARQEQD